MDEFDVTYAISDDEWRIIGSGGPGLEGEAAFNYLKGEVVLRINGHDPWTNVFHVSVADLALQFHQAFESGFPSRSSEALVSETDGGLDLHLKRVGDVVELRIAPSPARPRVEAAAYVRGAERFLRSFARELQARAPGALLADELVVLGRWL